MAEQSESSEAGQGVSAELRDVRYCEIIPVTRKERTLTAWVYNTLGLNDLGHLPPVRMPMVLRPTLAFLRAAFAVTERREEEK